MHSRHHWEAGIEWKGENVCGWCGLDDKGITALRGSRPYLAQAGGERHLVGGVGASQAGSGLWTKDVRSRLEKLKLQYVGQLRKSPWCWKRLKAGGEGGDRGSDGWTVSQIQWTWIWASVRRWWKIQEPGVLLSMGSQRVRHNWATEQQQ